jgi:ABC-type nitrate/sulfonate/bicarbonate transport system permease component
VSVGTAPAPVQPRQPTRPAARKKHLLPEWLFLLIARLVLLVLLVVFWQLNSGGRGSLLPTYAFGTPHAVGTELWNLVSSTALYHDLWSTVSVVIYASLISAPIGIVLALLTAVPVGRWLLQPIITISYAIPKVGLISILVLLMGLTAKTHIVMVTTGTLFLYYFSMRQAIEEVDRRQVIDLRLLGAGWPKVASALYLRTAFPHLIGATRLALPLGFAMEIFAELRVPTSSGLGALLQLDQAAGDYAGGVAVMLLVLLLGYVLDTGVGVLLRRYAASTGTGIAI